ncbi:YbbR-like domain-containing protein [Psychrobacillus sp. L3]|uniref:CdaR family protein n=1 Tax=Psychrobacillus sp. L3 TaxID=3236891 RepID=UPI0036F1B635
MDKMMDNPWFLRIIALVLAIMLFVSVKSDIENTNMNASGKSVDELRDVPVEVYYDDDSLVVSGVPKTVSVNIEGPSTLVLSAKVMKDYKVFVDLRKLAIGEHRVAISTENFSDKLKVRTNPVYVNVVIEERISQEFRVDPDMNESLLAENHIVKSYEVEPKVVTITGAKSVINSIGYVKATIEGEQGINKSFEQEARVRVLDKDLNKLDVSIEPKTVQVRVKVEEYSKEVPISLMEKGTPKQGVTINKLSTNVQNIRLYGPRALLDKIEKFIVDVDVSKIEDAGDFEVKLTIPDGVTKMSLDKIKIVGDVTPAPITEPPVDEDTISDVSEKSFDRVAVEVRGLPDQLESTFQTPTDGIISVTAKGTPEALDKITSSNIALYVEAQNAEIGENSLPIKMDAPSNVVWEMSASEVKLTIKEV